MKNEECEKTGMNIFSLQNLNSLRSPYDRSGSPWFALPAVSPVPGACWTIRRGCPLSPVLFVICMDRISRRSQGPGGVQFGAEPKGKAINLRSYSHLRP